MHPYYKQQQQQQMNQDSKVKSSLKEKLWKGKASTHNQQTYGSASAQHQLTFTWIITT